MKLLSQKQEEIELSFSSNYINDSGEERFGKEMLTKKPESIVTNYRNQIQRTRNQKEDMSKQAVDKKIEYITKYQLSYNIHDDSNQDFLEELSKLRDIELPKYIIDIEDSREKAYNQFREDFLAKLKSNIDEVHSEIKELNQALDEHIFGTDKYTFKVTPKQEYKNLYTMITDSMLLDGYNLATAEFNNKYANEIKELFDKVTSVDTISGSISEENENNIKTYTDYRTYLNFDLIVTDKTGNQQRLSKTLLKKSGGETQTPFYISILASFAQLYRIKNNDNTVRLIMFDEAFNKMDGERIEESIKLLKKIGFQVIFAAPPEKLQDVQSLVDTTLCVLNPKDYSIVVRKYTNKEEW